MVGHKNHVHQPEKKREPTFATYHNLDSAADTTPHTGVGGSFKWSSLVGSRIGNSILRIHSSNEFFYIIPINVEPFFMADDGGCRGGYPVQNRHHRKSKHTNPGEFFYR